MERRFAFLAGAGLAAAAALSPRPAHADGPVDCPSALEAPAVSTEAAKHCILYKIVHGCLQPAASDYCAACPTPAAGTSCAVKDECLRMDLWAQDADFIAMKDNIKTCGCPKDFVHGLALARAPATGVEDPRTLTDPKLAGAWPFAWKAALERIGDKDAVLLIANPYHHRSQDQLHIHLVRLAPGARTKLLSLKPGAAEPVELSEHVRAAAEKVRDLRDVWAAAREAARRTKFEEYGVAVIRDGRKYLVAAVDGSRKDDYSPEKAFALYECPERRTIK